MAENFNEFIWKTAEDDLRGWFFFNKVFPPLSADRRLHREDATFTPVYSLHRLHLSAQRRVYLSCDRV